MMTRIALLLAAALALQESVSAPPAALGLDPYYRKHLDAGGLPVVGSEKVPDAALVEARAIVARMT